MQIITVSSADVVKSGKEPNPSVKAPSSWNLGNDASYIAQVEVFHQIHCLNMLWKDIYYDSHYQKPPDELHLSHRGHCIYMILQVLLCNADVGVVTHNWVHNEAYFEPKTRPYPEFNTFKMCRDFDALMAWLREKGEWRILMQNFQFSILLAHPSCLRTSMFLCSQFRNGLTLTDSVARGFDMNQ